MQPMNFKKITNFFAITLVLALASQVTFAQDAQETETKKSDEKSEKSKASDSAEYGVGPSLGLNFPHALVFGIDARYTNYLGAAVHYGYFPSMSLLDTTLHNSAMDLMLQVYPFGGSFFLGASIGRQSMGAKTSTTVAAKTLDVSIDVSTTYVNPTLGWRWGGMKGFTVGMDFGVQLPVSHSTTLTVPVAASTPALAKTIDDVTKAGDTFGSSALPSWTVLQFGYLF